MKRAIWLSTLVLASAGCRDGQQAIISPVVKAALPHAARGVVQGRYLMMLKQQPATPAELRCLRQGSVAGSSAPATCARLTLDPLDVARRLAARHNATVYRVYRYAVRGFALAGLSRQAARAIGQDPDIALVEPDRRAHALGLPTGVDRIDADENATADIDGDSSSVDVDVAVIDTGVDASHPELNVVARTNCARRGPLNSSCADNQGDDGNGHGTHVAGTISAKDDGQGVVGVAPGARIHAVRVLDDKGSGYFSWIIAGIDWVTQHAATIEVANMSLGGQGDSATFHTAIQNSVAAGVFYAVAAGNSSDDIYGADGQRGTSDDYTPAAYPEVATISALADFDGKPGGLGQDPGTFVWSDCAEHDDDSFACFSNYATTVSGNPLTSSGTPVTSPGAGIDLMLPGVGINSTWAGGGTKAISGTSMASPHAAGLAALYVAANGRATNATGVADVRQALIDAGVAQTDARGLAKADDPDTNAEPLGWAGSAGCLADTECASSESCCSGSCTDTQSDTGNCGACGNSCSGGKSCVLGACQCASGEIECSGSCADTQTDASNCGGCGVSCSGGQTCQSGSCACPAGQTLCSGSCVDTQTDASNCGSCATVCASGESCQSGSCQAPSQCLPADASCDPATDCCEGSLSCQQVGKSSKYRCK